MTATRAVQPTRHDADAPLAQRLATELTPLIEGEVRFDDRARALYATDASPYEIWPLGVVLPQTRDDIRHVLRVAREHSVPVLPRGGGTSLAGQTVGRAIVVDVSKYMTEILEFDPKGRTVKVEPGVVRDALNAFLQPHGLQFTPDVSTTNRANVGGMVANNSAGTRSIKYGRTVDQIISMTVMLTDGTVLELGEIDAAQLAGKLAQDDREGHIYRTVQRIVSEHEGEIEARFPKVMRRVGGYNLDESIGGRPLNLAKLMSGSEGTLAFILELKLRLFPVPKHRVMALAHFPDMVSALKAVPLINRHGPSAVELIDDNMLGLGLENRGIAELLYWVDGNPGAVLMVEFDGHTGEEVLKALSRLHSDPELAALAYSLVDAIDPKVQHDVLEFRRAGLGLYSTIKGPDQPTYGIEDAAIPVENLQYRSEERRVGTR